MTMAKIIEDVTQAAHGIQLQESNRTTHQDLALTQLGLIKLTQLKT